MFLDLDNKISKLDLEINNSSLSGNNLIFKEIINFNNNYSLDLSIENNIIKIDFKQFDFSFFQLVSGNNKSTIVYPFLGKKYYLEGKSSNNISSVILKTIEDTKKYISLEYPNIKFYSYNFVECA
ncbi:MAG: hypothetical protein V1824_02915 [archaeon]